MIKIERDFKNPLNYGPDDWFELLIKPVKSNEKNLFDRIKEHLSGKSIFDFLTKQETLKIIITSKPGELRWLSIVFKKYFPDLFVVNSKGKSPINQAFNYDFFIDKYGQKHSNELKINVCPYCNRNFTSTLNTKKGEKIIRPDFDHFFSQKDHPLLALSFYNLIPSCQVCNSRLKGKKKFSLKTHFHPYLNGFEDEVSFYYLPNAISGVYGVQSEFEIVFEEKTGNYKKNLKGANEVFKYKEIYGQHNDVIEEIVTKLYNGSHSYFESLRKAFPHLNLTEAEMYRIAFGNYMENIDHEKRPFAKLTKDIFEKLK